MPQERKIRVGIGFDVHPFAPGRKLIIGGVEIDHPLGLEGVSDGDVVIHSLIDAILGATSSGDIGLLFPPDDPSSRDASSAEFLKKVAEMMRKKGVKILNVDIVVIMEKPKLSPYYEKIRSRLSELLGIPAEDIGFKAKTSEGIGDTGKGLSAQAFSAVLVEWEKI